MSHSALVCVPPGGGARSDRRRFLKMLGSGLLVPLAGTLQAAEESASQDIDPARLWDGDRQLVIAYKQGETLGEACRRLDAVADQLPVKLLWRLPPDWVEIFPTIHFEVSSRRWKAYKGWPDASHFVKFYEQFNPPPKSPRQVSPYKQYAADYDGPEWTYSGKIRHHLLDPDSPHQFSKYELQGLTKQEMEKLHSAHHEKHVKPGRRPPVTNAQLTQR